MKEVLAIIQMNKMESTKDSLDVIGIPAITVFKASGRGKQRGLQIPNPSQPDPSDDRSMKFICTPPVALFASEPPVTTFISWNMSKSK